MKKQNDLPELTPEEKLKAENELLKMKLTAEFGMKSSGTIGTKLPDDVENQWLNNIYNFEKLYNDAKRVKVLEYIGNPEFKKIDALSKQVISLELDRLLDTLEKNNVHVNFCCEYDDETIYKFITEELFEETVDDIRIEGMRTCFIYEEFHPNHDYDLRNLATDFFEGFLEREWNQIHSESQLYEIVQYKNKNIERNDFTSILLSFKEITGPFKIDSFQIDSVKSEIETKSGEIEGLLSYDTLDGPNISMNYSGKFKLNTTFNDYFWVINEIEFPGFD